MKRSQVWKYVVDQFVASGFWQELIHGGRHVRQVRDFTRKMIEMCDLDPVVAKCLQVAADVHDLGRMSGFAFEGFSESELKDAVDGARIDKGNPKYVDHAHLSANLFKLMTIEDMSQNEKDAVEWAVRNHSVGLVGLNITKAETLAEKVLGLLVIADHCGDAASPSGFSRAAEAIKNKPMFSNAFTAEHLWQYLDPHAPIIPVSEMGSYKNESLVAHTVYNYQASRPMISAVEELLSENYLKEEFRPQEAMFRLILESLLREQAKMDATRG